VVEFNRTIYFDAVRSLLFGGTLDQGQVEGQEAILTLWEKRPPSPDLRHLAYCLATTKHETASTMRPIEEYGEGAGQSYGVPDPETGQTYYGRGFVQLTWRNNYAYATAQLHLGGEYDLEWHAERALGPLIAAAVMFKGMEEGWFRTGQDGKPQNLIRYFSKTKNDSFGAREIINGDKNTIPDWSGGKSIGNLIAAYHENFLAALRASATTPTGPEPHMEEVTIRITATENVKVTVRQD
jgi:hypothetical protein